MSQTPPNPEPPEDSPMPKSGESKQTPYTIYKRLKTYKSVSDRDFEDLCKNIISSKSISGNTLRNVESRSLTIQDNPENLPPFNWLPEAKIYNQDYIKIPSDWITNGVEVIVLNFSLRDTDRPDNIMQTFYEMYENARYVNLPMEVINVPMDDNKEDMCISYDEQANWFTLMFNDPLIVTLQYIYGITAVPHLVVIKTDGSVVSTHGISDLDAYGKNALITWISTSALVITAKRLSKALDMYGPNWKFLSVDVGGYLKNIYRQKYDKKPHVKARRNSAVKGNGSRCKKEKEPGVAPQGDSSATCKET